jgi:hypothetical protein
MPSTQCYRALLELDHDKLRSSATHLEHIYAPQGVPTSPKDQHCIKQEARANTYEIIDEFSTSLFDMLERHPRHGGMPCLMVDHPVISFKFIGEPCQGELRGIDTGRH